MSIEERLDPSEIKVGARARLRIGNFLHDVEIFGDHKIANGDHIVGVRVLDSEDPDYTFATFAERLLRPEEPKAAKPRAASRGRARRVPA